MRFFQYVTNTQAYQQKSENQKNESLVGLTPVLIFCPEINGYGIACVAKYIVAKQNKLKVESRHLRKKKVLLEKWERTRLKLFNP